MKRSELKPGTRVGVKIKSYEDYYNVGTIVSKQSPGEIRAGTILIQWDPPYDIKLVGDTLPPAVSVSIKNLLPIDQAKKQANKLEAEFMLYEKKVLAKMKEAAKLILESNKVAKKAGLDNLLEMYDAIYPLLEAMDASGWNSSSFNC